MTRTGQLENRAACRHHGAEGQGEGVVVVALGNELRGDDAIASRLLSELNDNSVCKVNLECYTSLLSKCLKGHQCAIIIDAISAGGKRGSSKTLNLSELFARGMPLKVGSGHCLSFFDELMVAALSAQLPPDILFFGVETGAQYQVDAPGTDLQQFVPALVEDLKAALLELRVKSNA